MRNLSFERLRAAWLQRGGGSFINIQVRVLLACSLSLSAIRSKWELSGTSLEFSEKRHQMDVTEFLEELRYV